MSTMDKIKAKVENVLHPHDHTTTGTTTGTTGTTHTAGTTHSGTAEGVAGLVFSASFVHIANIFEIWKMTSGQILLFSHLF